MINITCKCNKNIIEGQEQSTDDTTSDGICTLDGIVQPDLQKLDCLGNDGIYLWKPNNIDNKKSNIYYIMAEDKIKPLFTDPDNFQTHLTQILNYMEVVLKPSNLHKPPTPYNMTKISDFGDINNINNLDYIEGLIRKFIYENSTTLYENLGKDEICEQDMTIYVLVFLLHLYGIDSNSTLDGDEYHKYLVIIDRLSKYIPDILEKIQQIYEDNCQKGSYDPLKHKLINNIYETLLKNNITKISFTGLSEIMKKMDNVKTIYIVLFMICVTFIVIKFMGMFYMNLNF